MTRIKKQRTANSTYPKVAVKWLNQALCFYSSAVQVDPEVSGCSETRHCGKRQSDTWFCNY